MKRVDAKERVPSASARACGGSAAASSCRLRESGGDAVVLNAATNSRLHRRPPLLQRTGVRCALS